MKMQLAKWFQSLMSGEELDNSLMPKEAVLLSQPDPLSSSICQKELIHSVDYLILFIKITEFIPAGDRPEPSQGLI
jgi:hypothetical protein